MMGPGYPPMRSMAGPSGSTSGPTNGMMADLVAGSNSAAMNGLNSSMMNNNNNNNNNMSAGSSGCGGMSTSSLFNALQQEVAEETRIAALNAMTQRIMNSLEGNI